MSRPATMTAARLYGPKDLRVDQVPHPGAPGHGQILLRVTAVGICGSDLHTYQDARIGDTLIESPLTLGHEFAGIVEEIGDGLIEDGEFQPLHVGTRVAVDPAQPCGRCEMCERGHPNLCRRLHFCGLYPDAGSLSQWMLVPAHTCFSVPDTIDNAAAALLEPLGVAIHATDLAKVRVAESAVILGAGPIGLSLLQTLRASGAQPIYVVDQFPWRLALAEELGGIPIHFGEEDPIAAVYRATMGRGVDIAVEAAWADHSIQWCAEMARVGGRVVLVGIPGNNRFEMNHATARRKGLTIHMSRRMKHVYARAIRLVESGTIDVNTLISHRFPLEEAPQAFALNDAYQDQVIKVIIEIDHT
jgi:L-iditol 2-dehydrogenase